MSSHNPLKKQKEDKSVNETLKTLVERRSCRSYKPDLIPQEVLDNYIYRI